MFYTCFQGLLLDPLTSAFYFSVFPQVWPSPFLDPSLLVLSTLASDISLFGSLLLSLPPMSAAASESLQLCLTLCDPIDGSPPGSPVPGILQARTLEWAAISFSNEWKWKVKVKSLSCVWLVATRWTAAYQAPPSMGFSRQEYWSRVPVPSPPPMSK